MKINPFHAIKTTARQLIGLRQHAKSSNKRRRRRQLSCQSLQRREVMAAEAFEFCERGEGKENQSAPTATLSPNSSSIASIDASARQQERSTLSSENSTTVGFYQPDASLFHLKNSFSPGASDQYFGFGPENGGWQPIVGDWNGDGTETIGLYQPDNSLFHLKDSFSPGAADQYFRFGPSGSAGWIPIAGDWDGDGRDSIGLYEPGRSLFHLKNSFTPGAADQYFVFGPDGNAGWQPLVGDWNGDGRDTIGLYEPGRSLFHLKDSFSPGTADQYFVFGAANSGWTPMAGDWNGDGVDTVGLHQPDASLFHLKDSFTSGPSDQYFNFGPVNGGWIPLAGDWDGSGDGSGGDEIPEIVDTSDTRRNDRDFIGNDGLGLIPRQLTDSGLVSQVRQAPPITRSTNYVIEGFVGNGGSFNVDTQDAYDLRFSQDAEVTIRLRGFNHRVGLILTPGGRTLPIANTGERTVTVNVPASGKLRIQVDTNFSLDRIYDNQNYQLEIDVRM